MIASFDMSTLVRPACSASATVSIECSLGETLVEDVVLVNVHTGDQQLPEQAWRRAIRLASSRTFEEDPKYAIRLLVDNAIWALSPAILNRSVSRSEGRLHGLYWSLWKERWVASGPLGPAKLSIDRALEFIAAEDIFWTRR